MQVSFRSRNNELLIVENLFLRCEIMLAVNGTLPAIFISQTLVCFPSRKFLEIIFNVWKIGSA